MPTVRKRNHRIEVIWLQRDLTIEDRAEPTSFGRTRKIMVTGHAGDAMVVETTDQEQQIYFLSPAEYHERFEHEDDTPLYYDRVAPPARQRGTPWSPTRTQPLQPRDLVPLNLPEHC